MEELEELEEFEQVVIYIISRVDFLVEVQGLSLSQLFHRVLFNECWYTGICLTVSKGLDYW